MNRFQNQQPRVSDNDGHSKPVHESNYQFIRTLPENSMLKIAEYPGFRVTTSGKKVKPMSLSKHLSKIVNVSSKLVASQY